MLKMTEKSPEDKIQQAQSQSEQESQEDEHKVQDIQEQGKKLVKTLSSNIALYFNKIIFLLNKSRRNMEIQLEDNKVQQRVQIGNQISQQKNQQNQENKGLNQQDSTKQKTKGKNSESENQQSKPKKPVSSFFVFYQQKSKELASKHGEIVGPKIAQIVAQAWNSMSEQQKKPFLQKANETKQKYKEEMRQYLEQHAVQIEEMRMQKRARNAKLKQIAKKIDKGEMNEEAAKDLMQQNDLDNKLKGISLRQMKVEQRKDYSHRPKAPVSSFFIFYQTEAKNIAKQHNVTVGSQLAKLASAIWKKMPIEKKIQYEQKAKQQREKYHIQMLNYRRDFPEQVQKRKKTLSANMKRKNRKEDTDENKADLELSVSSIDSSVDNSIIPSNQEEQSDSYQSSTSLKKQDLSLGEGELQIKLPSPKKKEKVVQKRVHSRKDVHLFPHRPKGPICSFFQYYHKNLKTFMNNTSSLQKDPGSQFVRRASAIWKSMSTIEKQPYHNLAKLDRERYQNQMQKYKNEYPQEHERFKIYNKERHSNPKMQKLAKQKLQVKYEKNDQHKLNSVQQMAEKIQIQSDDDSSDSSSDISSSSENLQK